MKHGIITHEVPRISLLENLKQRQLAFTQAVGIIRRQSYGESATVNANHKITRMRFLRMRPLSCARTIGPASVLMRIASQRDIGHTPRVQRSSRLRVDSSKFPLGLTGGSSEMVSARPGNAGVRFWPSAPTASGHGRGRRR